MIRLGAFLFALLLAWPAFGQSSVRTRPSGFTTVVAKATIASTNVYQLALAGSNARLGCTIQNNGTHTVYVFFGTAAPSDTTNSIQLAAAQALYCGDVGGTVAIDPVWITGTSGDVVVVNSQSQ